MDPKDIYLFTVLPKRGEQLTLFGARPGGQFVGSLWLEFCKDQTKDKWIDIKTISHLELKVITFTVTRICRSATLHMATRSQMQMVVDYFRSTILNWCEAVLGNVKRQLTMARNRQLKKFGYSFLVVSFSLERVPMLVPQHLSIGAGLLREPKLMHYVAVMACHSEESSEVVQFPPEYFHWLENQVFVIQDFPYAGMDYLGDPEMTLPPGEQWDDSGKIIFKIF